MTVNEMYNFLVNEAICTEEFLSGAVMMGGLNEETLNACLYYNTGYRDFEQYIEWELEEA